VARLDSAALREQAQKASPRLSLFTLSIQLEKRVERRCEAVIRDVPAQAAIDVRHPNCWDSWSDAFFNAPSIPG